jgi:DNA-binding transcriptional LysR family regulator
MPEIAADRTVDPPDAQVAMEFRRPRSFMVLAELGGTAEQLHLNPPAVHNKQKTLEGELGIRL